MDTETTNTKNRPEKRRKTGSSHKRGSGKGNKKMGVEKTTESKIVKTTNYVKGKSYSYIGFTTDKGLIIDLDGSTLVKAGHIAEKLLKDYNLEGYLIIQSSRKLGSWNYHLVFNAYVDWKTITKILFGFNKNSVIGWAVNQMRRGDLTLRISTNRGFKPKIVKEKGATDKLISEYKQIYHTFKEY